MAKDNLQTIAFPKLTGAQLAALGHCSMTRHRRFRAGEKLFAACDREPAFFVVISGEV